MTGPPAEPDPVGLLVSRRVGLVTELSPQDRGPDEPAPTYLYTATMAHFDFRMASRQDRLSAGKGRTERAAKLSALGEAVERYSAYHVDQSRIYLADWDEVSASAMSPADLVLYSDEQYRRPGFPFARWDPSARTSWIDGVELPSGRPIALPSSLVYLAAPARPEDFFTAATSNGLAAGPSLEAAILSGLYELIERDALLICWMNRLPAVEIRLPEDASLSAAIVRHYARFAVRVRLFLLPTDLGAAVVMALAEDEDPRHPARLIGMGCDLDGAVAVEKAIFELCQARPSEKSRFRERVPDRLSRYEDVRELEDHPAFLSLPQNAAEFDFLSASGESRPLADLESAAQGSAGDDLATCVAALVSAGSRVAYVDITAPDVRSAGYVVVRALVSGLQPIHFGYGEERLGGERLFAAPRNLGFRQERRHVQDLNPCPHPLA